MQRASDPQFPDLPERFNLASWLLDHNLAARADKVGVRTPEGAWTYAQIADQTARVQAALASRGVGREQRTLLVLPDGIEFVLAWLATLRGGHVFTMVNPRLPAESYANYLEYTRAPVAFVHAESLDGFREAAAASTWLRHVVVVGGDETHLTREALPSRVHVESFAAWLAEEPVEACDTHRDELAGWLFTSGTSGKPKGAMHVHGDFAFHIERYAKGVLGLGETDVTMAVSKLFFGYATGTNLMFPFAVGGSTALFPERSTAEAVATHAATFQPTMLAAVPTTLRGLCALEDPSVDRALGALRFVLSAGEALPRELQERFHERFGVEILDGIGSAEMFHIYISNAPGDVRPGSLGTLVPGYEAKIVDAAEQPVARGETGVLWVRGGSTATGYWLDKAKSTATFRGDWTVTGDLFREDADGAFWYEGRGDDLLKVGGIWVAPLEVEECLLRHDDVVEVCVVGCEDADGLTVPLAYVVPAEGSTPGDGLTSSLCEHVKSCLAPYKAPRLVEFVEALPRNDRGKIARAELRARAATRGAGG